MFIAVMIIHAAVQHVYSNYILFPLVTCTAALNEAFLSDTVTCSLKA